MPLSKNLNHIFRAMQVVHGSKKVQVMLDIAHYSRSVISHGNSEGVIIEGSSGY